MTESLERLELTRPRYNAVATLLRERALREARSADRRLARKDRSSSLLGIPYGAKDLLAARGGPTTWGAPPYRDQVLDFDATAVARLRQAGAVLAAKLAMVQLAGGGGYRYASASLQGPTRNPWNERHWAGGSSSGSAAAVAAGLLPYSLGSETSGSIGTPSAFCGITGLRPTYGLVSRHGAMALSWTLDKIGPIARSTDDCALVLEAIAGSDPADPTSSGRGFQRLNPRAASAAARNARIGFAEEDVARHTAKSARHAFEQGLREMRRTTRRFRRAALPADLPHAAMVATVMGAEASTIFAELIASRRFGRLADEKQKAGLRSYLEITARDYLQAMRLRVALRDAFRRIFQDVDVILSVGRTTTAPLVTDALDRLPRPFRGSTALPGSRRREGNMALIAAGNLAGLPAIFFPCGFATDGLPVGFQLVGPPFSEPLLVAIAAAYQRETDHHLRQPP